jgi:hypothetical protein
MQVLQRAHSQVRRTRLLQPRWLLVVVVLGSAWFVRAPVNAQAVQVAPCPRCTWTPIHTTNTRRVRTTAALTEAVAHATPNTTILIDRGEYILDRTLDFSSPHVVMRATDGDAAGVILRGGGMTEKRVGVAISVSASDVTVADVTVGWVGFHGIQVRGERGASRVVIHNVHIVDTGQQLIKGSTDGGREHADQGLIACSTLEYTDHAPSNYTNAVDIIAGNNWVVRDNTVRRIRGLPTDAWNAGPAILFWGNSRGTIVERNVIVDSFRGIALGLGPGASQQLSREHEMFYDHQGGAIRNNIVVNLNSWADEGIEVNAAGAVAIDHNTVLTRGSLPWGISVRFPGTRALVRNNLTSKAPVRRNGGQFIGGGNVSGATADWFVDAAHGNVALNGSVLTPVDAGVTIPEVTEDAACGRRVNGRAADAGALEFRGRR